MKYLLSLTLCILFTTCSFAQENILVTNPEVDAVLKGNFEAEEYLPSTIINHPEDVVGGLISLVNTDTIKQYLLEMSVFDNRNTGSDTASTTFGIGAARRWSFEKFQDISAQNENRLLVSYLQFDQMICEMGQHRNIFATLPGIGPQRNEVIIVEGHLDSRCEEACDIDCIAHGMEDNGSGSALVLELARVMSSYAFNRTMVFLLTIGEEQGLFGANAFSTYCKDEAIDVYAVFNNDIVGGIICGETASPPGCPGLNDIDSINVRIYSSGSSNSKHKGLARFTKLEYLENVSELVAVPNVINIMSPEDRSGRGGDHIPFRMDGYPAVRFTSANEHGNGNPSTPDYEDRQHTMGDLLGEDTDGDGQLDTFFVDFNYLSRNAVINGNAMASAAMGPITPEDLEVEGIDDLGFRVAITDPNNYDTYRVGVRQFNNNDFDTILTINQSVDTIFGLSPNTTLFFTCASVDTNGIESLFSKEVFDRFVTATEEAAYQRETIALMQNRPNPFDEATTIGVEVRRALDYKQAEIKVHNMNGQLLATLPISLEVGINEVLYDYQYHQYQKGIYSYSLLIDGQVFDTKQMVYAY